MLSYQIYTPPWNSSIALDVRHWWKIEAGSNILNKRQSTVILSDHLVQTERHHLRCLCRAPKISALIFLLQLSPMPWDSPERHPWSLQWVIPGRNHRFTADLSKWTGSNEFSQSILIFHCLANQQTQPEWTELIVKRVSNIISSFSRFHSMYINLWSHRLSTSSIVSIANCRKHAKKTQKEHVVYWHALTKSFNSCIHIRFVFHVPRFDSSPDL